MHIRSLLASFFNLSIAIFFVFAVMARKSTQGRKKTEMKMIEKEEARMITFSKRRAGVFKKASELSTLCGVQIVLIVFSLAGKPFSFGSPSVESVINRFRNVPKEKDDYVTKLANRIRADKVKKLNCDSDTLKDRLEEEKRRGKMLEEKRKIWGYICLQEYEDTLDVHERRQLKEKMEALKENLAHQLNEMYVRSSRNINYVIHPLIKKFLEGSSKKDKNVTHPLIENFLEASSRNGKEVDLPETGERMRDASHIPYGWLKL